MKNYLYLIALSVCFFVNSANAATLLSNTTDTIINGQSSSINYATAGFENFDSISLDVHAVGDYDAADEFINFTIDGFDFGSFNISTPGVTATNVGLDFFDWDIQFSILISDIQWESFISDSILNITWSNATATGNTLNVQHFVSYEINGEPISSIPEPATIWLIGFGLIGLAGMRRKLLKT